MITFRHLRNAVAPAAILLVMTACAAVKVRKNVRNPDRYFQRAHARIAQHHRDYPRRSGGVNAVRFLIYNAGDCELISIDAPFWMVDAYRDIALEVEGSEESFDLDEEYDFDWRGLDDIREIGPGLLVEIEAEDNHILIWIE